MNVKNCEDGLKSAMHITNLKINYTNWERYVISQILISLSINHAIIFFREDIEAIVDEPDISRDIKPTLDKYSKFMIIQNDFANLQLCGDMIWKNIGATHLKKIPSLLELKSIMYKISIYVPMFVERVRYLTIKRLLFFMNT